jgi:hypothetical protein
MNFKDEALEVLRKLDYFGPDATVIVEKALRAKYIAGLRRAAEIIREDSDNGEALYCATTIEAEASLIEST